MGSFRKNTYRFAHPWTLKTSFSTGKRRFSVLTGAIIWVRFVKRATGIEGEDDHPAAGSRRPYGGRFCHIRRPGCGVPARPAMIRSIRAWRLDAALGLSVQSVLPSCKTLAACEDSVTR